MQLNYASQLELDENIGKHLSFKKYDLPYLKSKINDISLLNQDFQKNLLHLIFKINIFNSEIEEHRFHYQLSFSKEISEENQKNNKEIILI